MEAGNDLLNSMAIRVHIHESVKMIGEVLFSAERGSPILKHVVAPGQALVDDWDCLTVMRWHRFSGVLRAANSILGTQYSKSRH
ncbi:hypothetical protein R1flu_016040 [Riccia fluitans]|uniref:Legumain prodomain domain-containing protein n=1 Tax=Riccia fluitans TaxID=41844 RepID=A0ABD1YKP2_9MARC